MSKPVTFRIPATPTRELSPNGRYHWAVKNRYAKALKSDTMWAAKAVVPSKLPDTPWQLDYVVAWGYRQKRWDDDNIKAGLKYVQDGIAEVTGVNDKHMFVGTVEQVRDPSKCGYIEVTIRESSQ